MYIKYKELKGNYVIDNKQREELFRRELQELLDKHNAEIKAYGDKTLSSLLNQDITVVMYSGWDSHNNCLLSQHLQFVL